jgi:hypothetical protein
LGQADARLINVPERKSKDHHEDTKDTKKSARREDRRLPGQLGEYLVAGNLGNARRRQKDSLETSF